VKEAQKAKATCRMYTVGKGPIKVKDAKKAIGEKNSRKRPKKPVQEFIVKVDEDVDVEGEDDDDFLHPELQGKVFGDHVRDLFEAQADEIKFY
jgi:hypothetical protein